jgi:DNA-binding CsgD family transcriptional regulator
VCNLAPMPNEHDGSKIPVTIVTTKMTNDCKCHFLSTLAESIRDDFVFYTLDMEGRFTFISHSALPVLNLPPDSLLNRRIAEKLTDNPCNEWFRSEDWKRDQATRIMSGTGEMLDSQGQKVQLKIWQATVFGDGSAMGVSGLMQRTHPSENHSTNGRIESANERNSSESLSSREMEIMERVATLSEVERQIVDMVVDGNMNKKMASQLDVAVRTVESRRSRAMIKLKAKSLSDLVQIWIEVRRIESNR